MVIIVFKSRIRPGNEAEFQALANRMHEIARSMPGFISDKVYSAEDGERVSIHEWASAEDLWTWREHPEHVAAQKRGRERSTRNTRCKFVRIAGNRIFRRAGWLWRAKKRPAGWMPAGLGLPEFE